MKDVREKKCGCVTFAVGPPILCEKHQSRQDKKARREEAKQEKGLRRVVQERARDNGHDLSMFKEYYSTPGKWVAFCHTCGSMVIVYDKTPERGDQVAGQAVFKKCHLSSLVGALADTRDAPDEAQDELPPEADAAP